MGKKKPPRSPAKIKRHQREVVRIQVEGRDFSLLLETRDPGMVKALVDQLSDSQDFHMKQLVSTLEETITFGQGCVAQANMWFTPEYMEKVAKEAARVGGRHGALAAICRREGITRNQLRHWMTKVIQRNSDFW